MRKTYFLFLLVGLLGMASCQTEETESLTGDLYFPWLKLGSFYGQPDSVFRFYQHQRDSLGFEKLKEEDPTGTAYMMLLEEKDLLLSPYVYLKVKGNQTVVLYMDSATYEPFKQFDYKTLRANQQKVSIKATVIKLGDAFFKIKKIHRIDRLVGETEPKESKYRIENYK